MRRIYNDEDVVRFAKSLHSKGVYECTLDRVIEELKKYNDFSIHRVIISIKNSPFPFSRLQLRLPLVTYLHLDIYSFDCVWSLVLFKELVIQCLH